MPIELRSDTFTKPTPGMLAAMFSATVGDDVFEEDATTIALEQKVAQLFGYEAALFCVSGTMANQIAIKVHTQPGDEVICDALSHIYLYEGGGIATNSLASVQLLHGNRGRLSADQIAEVIKEDNIHYPVSRLVSLENTVNKGGGCFYDIQELLAIQQLCQKHQMALHLDGARLMNALVANQTAPTTMGNIFDSISLCLSKGLGTPMGSVLMGKASFIKQARRVRKRLGGGWRQSGYMAAAGIYALDNHVDRLSQDHHHAQALGALLVNLPVIEDIYPIDTNIIIATIAAPYNAARFVEQCKHLDIHLSAFGKQQIRLVTHLDFTAADLQLVEEKFKQLRF